MSLISRIEALEARVDVKGCPVCNGFRPLRFAREYPDKPGQYVDRHGQLVERKTCEGCSERDRLIVFHLAERRNEDDL